MSKVKNKSHKSLLFVAISILLSFLFIKLFDYALGFTLSSTASSFSNNRYVNLREHNPNSKIFPPLSVCSVLNLDKPVGIHSNSKGFLESNHVLNEGLKYKKIIFFGGSTTENMCVDSHNRFPALVGASLANDLDVNLTVLNAGVSGNNSIHSLISLQAKSITENPDLIFFMHAINDLSILLKSGSYWDQPNTRDLIIVDSSRRKISELVKEFINLIIPNFRQLLIEISAEKITNHDEFKDYRDQIKLSQQDLKKIQNDFKASVSSFIGISKAWNLNIILMTQPNQFYIGNKELEKTYYSKPQPINYEEFVELLKSLNEIIIEVSQDFNVAFIDLEKIIPKSNLFFYDSIHLNNYGNKEVANIISTYLIENKSLILEKPNE